MGSSCRRARLMSVVLPAPDGPDTMNRVPSGWKLLDILHLGCACHPEPGERSVCNGRCEEVDYRAPHPHRFLVTLAMKLLDILHLLADPLDLGFQFYNEGPEHRR